MKGIIEINICSKNYKKNEVFIEIYINFIFTSITEE